MGERISRQAEKSSEPHPTHILFPHASIQVSTQNKLFKWVTVIDQFKARLIKIDKKRTDMGLFEAWGDFRTWYAFDDDRKPHEVQKHSGDQFYAFTNPDDGLVQEIPKQWTQPSIF